MRAALLLVVAVGGCTGGVARTAPTDPMVAAVAPVDAAPAAAPSADAGAPTAAEVTSPAPAPADELDLAFAGDVMFGRFVKKGFRPIEAAKLHLFDDVAPTLDSDYTMVNLETPIVRKPPRVSPYGSRMRFVATPARVASLVGANVDAVTLANNHAYDMHLAGVRQTPAILDELGLRYVGAHRTEEPLLRAETVEVRGWRIAYVAATTVRNGDGKAGEPALPFAAWNQLRKQLVPVIAAARADHDLVIVVLHWGTEYADAPDSWQIKAAHAFVDAGADAVIGSHPHVLQGMERYKGALIAYSLGNFLFDNLYGRKRLHGILHLGFRRDGRCLARVVYHPTVGTHPQYKPVLAHGKSFTIVADRLTSLSAARPLATTWERDGDTLVAAPACE